MDAERWKRVDELLQAAVRLPAEQREAFLRQACAGDDLLVEEVRSLLRSHGELGDFLEKAALDGGIQNVAQTEAPGNRDLVGQTVAHYEVLRRLGSGGMGVVYEAKDMRLGRRGALKLLPEKLIGDERALRRFAREARAASSLNHPNICTIYEVEEHDHQPVIVMELLEGVSLNQRIREGPISTDELVDFGIQACAALEAAHAKGIIPRDIKPGNMFIVGHRQMKILDFGLAKVCGPYVLEDLSGEEPLTQDGVIPGTTSYMSPEQVRGEEIDARSDLFSFGVVLYEMATGRRPFRGETSGVIANAILERAPVPPVRLNPDLPSKLEEVINKALEKERKLRYQSAAEISADLQRLKRD